LLQTFQNPSLYKSIENPFFSSLCGANQTRSAALARYPLALPFFPLVKIPSQLTKKSVAFFLKKSILFDGYCYRESQIKKSR